MLPVPAIRRRGAAWPIAQDEDERDARDARRDAVRLLGADPDRDQTIRVLRLKEHDVLPGEDVHPDRFDGAEHQSRG